jgi:hypothetical protein
MSYIGRGEDWKIFPLLKVIQDCSRITNLNFELFIYTDSEVNYLKMLPENLPNIKINYLLNLSGLALHRSLYENSDLHFAMGTSALEGAILGIPTILLDYSHVAFPESYKYLFLHEAKNYSLGQPICGDIQNEGRLSISEIFEILSSELNYSYHANRSIVYVNEKHHLSDVAKVFRGSAELASMKIKHVLFFWRLMYWEARLFVPFYGLLNRLFSRFRSVKVICNH